MGGVHFSPIRLELDMQDSASYLPIEDYAVIGDCHTAALISSKGSIDWYCPVRFDNPACFCRILDARNGGFLEMRPAKQCSVSRRYMNSTNVLESIFTTDQSTVRVRQFMPLLKNVSGEKYVSKTSFGIISAFEGLRGETELRIRFKPTFDYARFQPRLEPVEYGVIASGMDHHLALLSVGLNMAVRGGIAEGEISVRAGEHLWIVLAYSNDRDELKRPHSPERYQLWLSETLRHWQAWADKCTYQGPYRRQVVRSTLALRLLTYEPSGAIVAAPTTSLPEEVGGVRNWDYRFTWLRDSALALYALMTVGYQDEATHFFRWLQMTQKTNPCRIPQNLYKIDGSSVVRETVLDHLEGYKKSKPVRIGNAAASQFQLDIFGEILNAAYLHFMHNEDTETTQDVSSKREEISRDLWSFLKSLVNDAADKWQEPDNGIWEIRGKPRQFLYSRLMCWAALDRGIKLARKFKLDGPIEIWTDTREHIREAILQKGFSQKRQAFTQAFGNEALDAGALIIPRIGFLSPTDSRVTATVETIQSRLSRHGLVYRYHTEDGLPGHEATFGLCSFWLVDALALGGKLDQAHDLFERILKFSNDVGLLSEELDASTGTFLGNHPQGLTHLALIGSAVNLQKAEKHGPEHEPETEAQRAYRARFAPPNPPAERTGTARQL
jgi:alpha,alpha-trehalase